MKFNKKHGIILIIGLIIILIIIGLILYLNKKPRPANIGNSYKFNGEEIELPNTVNYKNEKLSSKHCLKDICIEDANFYYNEEVGRVEYTITNLSNKTVSGYLVITYKDLLPKKSIKSFSQYMGVKIKDKSDYKLEKLSKEEIKKIIK